MLSQFIGSALQWVEPLTDKGNLSLGSVAKFVCQMRVIFGKGDFNFDLKLFGQLSSMRWRLRCGSLPCKATAWDQLFGLPYRAPARGWQGGLHSPALAWGQHGGLHSLAPTCGHLTSRASARGQCGSPTSRAPARDQQGSLHSQSPAWGHLWQPHFHISSLRPMRSSPLSSSSLRSTCWPHLQLEVISPAVLLLEADGMASQVQFLPEVEDTSHANLTLCLRQTRWPPTPCSNQWVKRQPPMPCSCLRPTAWPLTPYAETRRPLMPCSRLWLT